MSRRRCSRSATAHSLRRSREHHRARTGAEQAAKVCTEVARLVAEIDEAGPARELQVCERLLAGERTSAELAERAAREAADRVADLHRTGHDGAQQVEAFRREHGDPSDVIRAFDAYKLALADATQTFMTLARQVAELRAELAETLRGPVAAVVEWQLANRPPASTVAALLATVES